jgi:hypothetical protein
VPAGPALTARTVARENRKFLGRAVQFLVAEAGVRQFLDIGAGLPTTENVHQVAQRTGPAARIVYADNDPLVLVHARALLRSTPEGRTGYIHADLREPAAILADPVTSQVLDFTQPIGLILVSVLPFLTDDDHPGEILATLLGALPSGSYLAAAHTTAEHDPEGWAATGRAYAAAAIRGQLRDSAEFARMAFTGLDPVPPGVTCLGVASGRRRPAAARGRGELLWRSGPQALSHPSRVNGTGSPKSFETWVS